MKQLLLILGIAFCISGCKKTQSDLIYACGKDIDVAPFPHSFEKRDSFFVFKNMSDRRAISTIKVYYGSSFIAPSGIDTCNAYSNDTIRYSRFNLGGSLSFYSTPYDSVVIMYSIWRKACIGATTSNPHFDTGFHWYGPAEKMQ